MDNIKNNINNDIIKQTGYFSNGSNTFYSSGLNIKDNIEKVEFENLNIEKSINDFNFLMNSLISKYNKSYVEFNGMKLSNNGKFEDFADFQKINLAQLYIFNDQSIINKKWLDENGKINKTIDELLEIKNNDNLKKLQQYGLGKIKIVEVIEENDGMNAVVLQDTDGNYMIHYNCTNATQTQDIIYDIAKLINSEQSKKIINSEVNHNIDIFNEDILNKHVIKPTYEKVKDIPITWENRWKIVEHYWDYWLIGASKNDQKIAEKVIAPVGTNTINYLLEGNGILTGGIIKSIKYNLSLFDASQQVSSINLAKKYYEKAKKEGTKLNISGYSLGGSLAESSYLSLLNTYGDDNQVLNDITLFNPYHNNLTKEQVQQLKNHNIEIYCNEGDIVSGVFNQDDFKGVTKNIYIDYKTRIKNAVQEALKSDPNQWDELIAGQIAIYDLHSLEAANNRALKMFNENGSLKTIKFSRRKDIIPTEIPFDQLYDEILAEINRQRREQ